MLFWLRFFLCLSCAATLMLIFFASDGLLASKMLAHKKHVTKAALLLQLNHNQALIEEVALLQHDAAAQQALVRYHLGYIKPGEKLLH